MSLEEFADLVGMDPMAVRREADRGQLPGRRVGGKWRFNRVQVHEWLEERMLTLPDDRLRALDRAIGRLTQADSNTVTGLIGIEGIDLALRAATKASVLRELVNLADRTGLLYDAKGLLEALREREADGGTAMPHGLAIPHPAKPMPYTTAEPLICVARLANPVAFSAPDGALTHLFFLICSHDSDGHLHVLARLLRMMDDATIDALRAVASPSQVLQLLIERERVVASANQR
jgi:PTS system nitrogen regulatory IIA component